MECSITVEQIVKAAASFKRSTSTPDSFHPRWFGGLGQPALEALVRLMFLFELTGFTPFSSLVRMLPKPTGGWRPIALLAALIRLYSKVRLQQVTAWVQSRPYRSQVMVAHRTASDSVWRTQLRAGVARAESRSALELAWDLQKAFDSVPYATLVDIAIAEK